MAGATSWLIYRAKPARRGRAALGMPPYCEKVCSGDHGMGSKRQGPRQRRAQGMTLSFQNAKPTMRSNSQPWRKREMLVVP